ncbi:hypothetical protein C8J57DRAFT_1230254 [Mycena rebaudengoi]|nr:hypothetical protein C8J57DRAFT_1230254 [Mycena rebaudengoi]
MHNTDSDLTDDQFWKGFKEWLVIDRNFSPASIAVIMENMCSPNAPPIFDSARAQIEIEQGKNLGMEKNFGKGLEPSSLQEDPTLILSICYFVDYVKALRDASKDVLRGHESDEIHAGMTGSVVGLRFMIAAMRLRICDLGVDEQSAIAYADSWLEDRFNGVLWGMSLPRRTNAILRLQREFRKDHRHWDCTIVGVPPGAEIELRAEGWIKAFDDFEMRAVPKMVAVPAARWRGWFRSAIKRGRGAVCGC